jgi:hypothetical protein
LIAGRQLSLNSNFALAFGDALAYCLTEVSPGLSSEFERGMAHQRFNDAPSKQLSPPFDVLAENTWLALQSNLQRVYEQFEQWQHHPESYQTARATWYRALNIELNLNPSNFNPR